MKIFFLSLTLVLSMAAKSQVVAVSLKASGLTCSMCSNAINNALKTLDFIDHVEADIKNYSFEISFKKEHVIDFDKIKKKVEDAGFFVSAFAASIDFTHAQKSSDHLINVNNMSFYFLNEHQPLNGLTQIKILNKGFVSSKEYKLVNLPKQPLIAGIYYATIN